MSSRGARPEWAVPVDVARSSDVDERLRAGAGRTGLLQKLIDHDTPAPGRCSRCGWVATSSRRDCPSRVIAKALLERKPLPVWLAHLVADVPAARPKATPETREQQRSALDAAPGLFDAPARVPELRRSR